MKNRVHKKSHTTITRIAEGYNHMNCLRTKYCPLSQPHIVGSTLWWEKGKYTNLLRELKHVHITVLPYPKTMCILFAPFFARSKKFHTPTQCEYHKYIVVKSAIPTHPGNLLIWRWIWRNLPRWMTRVPMSYQPSF